jgi:nitrite reductase/ring-hydroxylating ferredoxin subunit
VPEGKPVLRDAAGTPVLLVRTGERIDGLANRCAHQAGPLHEGTLHDGCVTCPWHGSTFRMSTGAVVHGPSVHPQPALDVRRREGRLEVRLRA